MSEERVISHSDIEKAINSVKAIEDGPRALQLYMDICAKCGTCAEQCHVSKANPNRRTNPAAQSDLIRKLYKQDGSILTKISGLLNGNNKSLSADDLQTWVRDFYECSGCRRCALYCPFGIDNSVITRKGRAIVHALGLSPKMMVQTQETSDKFGNDEGQTYKSFMNAVEFLESELEEEHGIPIKIPVDQEADILFVPASADLISFPETQMGSATFFHAAGLNWTMSSKAFDGANFGLFTGDDAHMKRKNKVLHDACLELKVKKLVIGECGHAYRIAKRIGGPFYWGNDIPYEVTNIFILAAEKLRKGAFKLDPGRNAEPVTYHDPCNFARSTGVIEEPRALLRACVTDFREMTPNRENNWCCGGGGGLAVMDGKEGVKKNEVTFMEYRMNVGGKMKLNQIKETGAKYVAAPCANCKRQIMQLMDYHKMDVKVGGVFDLFDKAVILDK
ncbi:MAG TPA: (Fe-S)-binding protein [Deltaproteobacteria bacterium]|nr:(Fe-S)-binding protein [Deltaproteobacteria bacterium]